MKVGLRKLAMPLAVVSMAFLFAGFGVRVLASCSGFGLPFTDLGSETTFCAAIAEAYFSGLTNGTSATTYDPTGNVPRDQMAAFITRTLDQSLLRGSPRAALDQWWTQTPHYDKASLGLTSVGDIPILLKSDGADVWVANRNGGTVSRVRGSDGTKLEDWTGATSACGVLIALGRVFVTGDIPPNGMNQPQPGKLYMIDPAAPAGPVIPVTSALASFPCGIAFDGSKIWTASSGGGGQPSGVSIVTPGTWSVATVTTGFSELSGIIFDGSHIWVADFGAAKLFKLDANGAILQTVTVGTEPANPAFDGHNLWVPNWGADSLTVVRASDGTVLKTFSAANGNQNGLSRPNQAAFDGQRILVSDSNVFGFSLFKAADLSVIGNVATPGIQPFGVCSDGISFWVTFPNTASPGTGKVGRF
ncbi:MAG TPA: hypothetical protein VFS34_06645 [Thermoanaerobaculia bacterium]|nr:hypothetical protein [Thermoanaerobaculia bacterium]